MFLSSNDWFQNQRFRKFFQEYHQSVKQFGTRQNVGPDLDPNYLQSSQQSAVVDRFSSLKRVLSVFVSQCTTKWADDKLITEASPIEPSKHKPQKFQRERINDELIQVTLDWLQSFKHFFPIIMSLYL